MARSYIELTGAAALVQAGARGFDARASGAELGILANAAKYAASEAAFRTTDDAMQIFGGYSFAREFHIGRHWIESRLQRIAPINNQMILNYIAERVLFLPRSY